MPFSYDRAKRELLAEQSELEEQLERLVNSARHQTIGLSNHMADDGTEAFEQTVGVALQRKVESSLEEVDRALAKFADGTYGICEACGSRIDRARLEAFPHARCCLDCQARHEHNSTQAVTR